MIGSTSCVVSDGNATSVPGAGTSGHRRVGVEDERAAAERPGALRKITTLNLRKRDSS